MVSLTNDATYTYLQMKPLLINRAWDFFNRYGGDQEEYESICDMVFLKTFLSFDPCKNVPFSALLAIRIEQALIDHIRREIRLKKYQNYHAQTSDVFKDRSHQQIDTILDLPLVSKNILTMIWDVGKIFESARANYRSLLKDVQDTTGLNRKQATKRLSEIKDALISTSL